MNSALGRETDNLLFRGRQAESTRWLAHRVMCRHRVRSDNRAVSRRQAWRANNGISPRFAAVRGFLRGFGPKQTEAPLHLGGDAKGRLVRVFVGVQVVVVVGRLRVDNLRVGNAD